jgi:hypothetical protein
VRWPGRRGIGTRRGETGTRRSRIGGRPRGAGCRGECAPPKKEPPQGGDQRTARANAGKSLESQPSRSETAPRRRPSVASTSVTHAERCIHLGEALPWLPRLIVLYRTRESTSLSRKNEAVTTMMMALPGIQKGVVTVTREIASFSNGRRFADGRGAECLPAVAWTNGSKGQR